MKTYKKYKVIEWRKYINVPRFYEQKSIHFKKSKLYNFTELWLKMWEK